MSSTTGEADKLPSLTSTQPCIRFSLAEIQSATEDFDDELVIGHGGFGKVYKGCICIQEIIQVVAIKRLDSKSNQGEPEFRTEIEMLSKLRHCHLVSLIGYCNENKEMILVYAYMSNGTLYHHLHEAETPLDWVQRLKIAIGAARGLDYLHTGVGTQHGVIHRDVKSSNILLDENWEAMISDFGLSKIGPINQSLSYVDVSIKGTFGYLDPEYFYTRKVTRKTDVYSFGVVLLELLSGRLAIDEHNGVDHCSLVRWAQRCIKEKNLDQMVDSNIRGTISPKCLKRFAQISARCVHVTQKERPSMTEVVASLQALLELQNKSEDFVESSSILGFTWKIPKYLAFTTKQNSEQGGTSSSTSTEMTCHHRDLMVKDLKCFSYYELRRATDNFGNGKSYGKFYKGWIDGTTYSPSEDNNTLSIAIKRLDFYKPASQLNVKFLKEFSHPNLVELIGYCLEGAQVFLVYESIPNGNFHHLLHSGGIAQLPLVLKVKIALGIAQGIVFLNKTQDQGSDESQLYRRSILLDKDFTPKFSDYDITELVDGGFTQNIPDSSYHQSCYCYPGCNPFQLQRNLSGFTTLFAEVLTGKQVYDEVEFQKIDDLFIQHGKTSLVDIAKYCFEICNEVDPFSRMLTILEEYEHYIPAFESTTELASESCLLELSILQNFYRRKGWTC